MRTKLIAASILVSFFAFSSCQKDTTPPTTPTYSIYGLWIGTYTIDTSPSQSGVYFYSYAVYPDGAILIKGTGADGQTYYSTGEWKLSNTNVFSATYTTINFNGPQVTQTLTANFSNTGKMTNGVWIDTKNGSQSGKLSMERVN